MNSIERFNEEKLCATKYFINHNKKSFVIIMK